MPIKHSYNRRWRLRDEAYSRWSREWISLIAEIARTAQSLAHKDRRSGRSKLEPWQYVVLAAVREKEGLRYRELPAVAERLFGVRVHYTAIHKGIGRNRDLIALTASLAAPLGGEADELVVDSTEFSLESHELVEGKRRRLTVKLVAGWDPLTHMFHVVMVAEGEANDSRLLEPLTAQLFFKPRKLYADRGFFSRRNVELLASLGMTPVIRPKRNATPRAKGCPAYRRLVRRYLELGYRAWAKETGYAKRFPEEHAFSNLIVKHDGWVRARSIGGASSLVYARVLLHNAYVLKVIEAEGIGKPQIQALMAYAR